MSAVPIPRWQQAQELERGYWMEPGKTDERLAERIEDAPWFAGLLNIRQGRLAVDTVLDIGAGPLPLGAALGLDIGRYDVLDPCDYGPDRTPWPVTRRIMEPAEWFKVDDGAYAEAWGYNVLQHVIDPEAVIATAKKAARVVRWLDWTNTPIHTIHPHSITAGWLRQQFGPGWRITFDTEGTIRRPEWSHDFIALVAERRDG